LLLSPDVSKIITIELLEEYSLTLEDKIFTLGRYVSNYGESVWRNSFPQSFPLDRRRWAEIQTDKITGYGFIWRKPQLLLSSGTLTKSSAVFS